MARGQVLQIASGTNQTVTSQSREEKRSFIVYNPNDGVTYFKLNGPASPQPGAYDWKLPAQSGGAFGGPWQSLGIYFLDQSGAGRQGEVNLFDSDNDVEIPNIWAIGRSLQAQVTTLDVTQGPQPANPPVGVSRLWSDNNGFLYELLSTGTNEPILEWIGSVSAADLSSDLSGGGGVTVVLSLNIVPGKYWIGFSLVLANTAASAVAPDINFEDAAASVLNKAAQLTIPAGATVSFFWSTMIDMSSAANPITLRMQIFPMPATLFAKAFTTNSTLPCTGIRALRLA